MTLAAARARYAGRMTAALPRDAATKAIRAAYAAVPRENFAGPPPWHAFTVPLGLSERIDNPAGLYKDVLVRLDPRQGINNGSPALHAHMLHLLGVRPGERVLHAGAGGGYYTAMLAELVGPAGEVVAVEHDADLARAARDNLRPWAQVRVEQGDAAAWPREPVHRIYVNFALADPADLWLDRLEEGGVLLCPLGVPQPAGLHTEACALLCVHRVGDRYDARFNWHVAFVFAAGPTAGDAATQAALRQAFARGGEARVRGLLRGPADPARCWMTCARYSLTYDTP